MGSKHDVREPPPIRKPLIVPCSRALLSRLAVAFPVPTEGRCHTPPGNSTGRLSPPVTHTSFPVTFQPPPTRTFTQARSGFPAGTWGKKVIRFF